MKKKELKEILYESPNKRIGDDIITGLNVIQKYFPEKKIVRSCIESIFITRILAKKICKAGLTYDDAIILRDTGWDIDENGLMCHSI